MADTQFLQIPDNEKTQYMDLLRIADEQVSMIQAYLYRGELFALCDGGVRAVCVVTQERPGVYELKNIVTVPGYERQGYGQRLIEFVAEHCKGPGRELYVGTGDCPGILRFYQRCGFTRSHVVKNFFTDHYDHPMYEDGEQLIDMVYLKRAL